MVRHDGHDTRPEHGGEELLGLAAPERVVRRGLAMGVGEERCGGLGAFELARGAQRAPRGGAVPTDLERVEHTDVTSVAARVDGGA